MVCWLLNKENATIIVEHRRRSPDLRSDMPNLVTEPRTSLLWRTVDRPSVPLAHEVEDTFVSFSVVAIVSILAITKPVPGDDLEFVEQRQRVHSSTTPTGMIVVGSPTAGLWMEGTPRDADFEDRRTLCV
jgi:hypothetical protein